ncbi:hypothetical protein SLA2020_470470 [Shorea laevis]
MDSIFSSGTSSCCYISLIFFIIFKGAAGATFTVINKCDHTVWPGTLGNSQLDSTGFELPPGGSRSFQAPPNWSGRFWGRTGCTSDPTTGQLTCITGDCRSNQLECNGNPASPPTTLAEFTIGSSTAQDFYDVSLVDGYNLPMIIEPSGGSGTCQLTGCAKDLNRKCPDELRVGSGDACKSACEAFGNPEYCCSGAYASPATCKPSRYSEIFKSVCPKSYSYAFDDPTSTFTCTGADYMITFCPSSTSLKSASSTSPDTTATGGSETDSGDFASWLPDFLTGESSKTLSGCVFYTTLLTTLISHILLTVFYS